ncbi:hypothetical protein [Mesorhizobium sp. WSM2239]|uniref:Uncharacterized protein n=2 Tax=unclassified Mesorhizobium TaxID=325217 RepID=A0AAU8DFG9_9HYPH
MDMDRAIAVLGINRTRDNDLRPMVRALGMMTWLNTPGDELRRDAAKYVLRRWSAYQTECNRRRDARSQPTQRTRKLT